MSEGVLDYEPAPDADVPPAFGDVANDQDVGHANLNSAIRVMGVYAVIPFNSPGPGNSRVIIEAR